MLENLKLNMAQYAWLMAVGLVLWASCSGGTPSAAPGTNSNPGFTTFKTYCVTCHGKDGKLGLSGAANLSASTLSKQEAIEVISNGRKLMAPYKSILSPQEIEAVADYILTLRK